MAAAHLIVGLTENDDESTEVPVKIAKPVRDGADDPARDTAPDGMDGPARDGADGPGNDAAAGQDPDAELSRLLSEEKQKTLALEERLKHSMADFQNLERRAGADIENGVGRGIDRFMLDFLQIYDDFVRARAVAAENRIVTDGLDSILRNMDSLLSKYGVSPIEAIGEIFDPNLHEAISTSTDDSLDENTVTKEIRRGYASRRGVIRPALVEIAKKLKPEQSG